MPRSWQRASNRSLEDLCQPRRSRRIAAGNQAGMFFWCSEFQDRSVHRGLAEKDELRYVPQALLVQAHEQGNIDRGRRRAHSAALAALRNRPTADRTRALLQPVGQTPQQSVEQFKALQATELSRLSDSK